MKANENPLFDLIRGCMLGGAIGDALGYSVEFVDADSIFERFGAKGITEYLLASNGKALISDDTQMTLFTANGMLIQRLESEKNGLPMPPRVHVARAYQDWYFTQMNEKSDGKRVSWLCEVKELYRRRAPGNTCLSALREAQKLGLNSDGIKYPVNSSMGCGGVMRVAPVALCFDGDLRDADMEAAQIAAVTHGHPLGYLPAAFLCHVIRRAVLCREGMSLPEIVCEARDTVVELFPKSSFASELAKKVNLALSLVDNGRSDLENITLLGEGWTGDEALYIAIYCSVKYSEDLSAGVIAAVNHSGDSDSTGAVTGNILGAWLGLSAIEDKWMERLELSDVILEIADDICRCFNMTEFDDERCRKYLINV